MKKNSITNLTLALAGTAACAFFTSCETVSISNPGSGGGGSYWGSRGGGNSFYNGELKGLDVLGVPEGEVTESAIQSALGKSSGTSVRIPRGSRVMLVQSGAIHPDAELQKAMSKYYDVVPFSGVPRSRNSKKDQGSDARRLRLAAAQAGVQHLVVVWGTLESTKGDLATSTVSWVPIAGRVIADEQKATRLVTTAVVMETGSGTWRSVSAEPVVRRSISSDVTRNASWSRQVESLKSDSYPSLATKVSSL